MRYTVIFLILFGFTTTAVAQQVTGVVRDATTARPVAGAQVQSTDNARVAVTDDQGRFVGSAEGGTIRISAPGYEAATVAIGSAVEVWLLPAGAGEAIEVRGRVTTVRPPGATPMEREEVTHLPGSRGDALSAIKSFPGIANNGSLTPGSAGVIIRGSSPKDSKIFVDGFEVPVLYHFLGLQSVFASEMVEHIDYKPGGFGVEYGRASAGTIAVTSRKGNREYAALAEMSFVNLAAFAQGPIGKRGSFALAVRRSLIDAVVPLALPSDSSLSFTALPRYYDFQGRADWQLDSKWSASLLILGSDDAVDLLNDDENPDDPAASGRFVNETGFVRAITAARYEGDDVTATLALSAQLVSNKFEVGADRHLRLDNGGAGVRGSVGVQLSKSLSLNAGGEGDVLHVHSDIRFPRPPREGDGELPGFSFEPLLQVSDSTTRGNAAVWSALTYEPNQRLQLKGGLRFDAFLRPQEYVLQPRGQVRFAVNRQTALVGAAGLYTRPPDDLDENLQTDLKPERSIQFVGGVEQTLAPGATVQANAFYTDRRDLVAFRTDRMNVTDQNAAYGNVGKGRSYGAELLARYRSGRTFAWLAYTLSRSERRDGDDPTMRPFDFDQTHNVIAVYSRVLGAARHWRVGGRFQLTTGNPFTPVESARYRSDADFYEPTFGAANSVRLETQHQLDLRVDRIWRFSDWKLSAYLDISNVYANAAVIDYTYNFDYSEREEFTTLPIIPSLGIKGEF